MRFALTSDRKKYLRIALLNDLHGLQFFILTEFGLEGFLPNARRMRRPSRPSTHTHSLVCPSWPIKYQSRLHARHEITVQSGPLPPSYPMLDDRLATDADAGSHKMLQVMVEESVALKYHQRTVS